MSTTNILKTTTTSRASTTTLADDPDFNFTPPGSAYYKITLFLIVRCASATPDFKFDFDAGGGIEYIASYEAIDENGNNSVSGRQVDLGTDVVLQVAANTNLYVQIELTMDNPTTANFALRWAQNVSNASAMQVLEGSFMQYELVGVD